MSSPNGAAKPEASRLSGPPEPPGKIIPLIPGVTRGTGDRRAMLRAAVLQVVSHLVERAVPPAERVPLFDQAKDLLDEAGWGLDELACALERGRAQDALLSALGLLELDPLTALTRPTAGGDMTDQRRYRRHRMSRASAPTTRAPPWPPHAADVPVRGQGNPGPPQPFSIPALREQFSAPGHGRVTGH